MKSIASMLFVLAAALLLSSPTQAGYADGMNQYAGYHVMHGDVDPFGEARVGVEGRVNWKAVMTDSVSPLVPPTEKFEATLATANLTKLFGPENPTLVGVEPNAVSAYENLWTIGTLPGGLSLQTGRAPAAIVGDTYSYLQAKIRITTDHIPPEDCDLCFEAQIVFNYDWTTFGLYELWKFDFWRLGPTPMHTVRGANRKPIGLSTVPATVFTPPAPAHTIFVTNCGIGGKARHIAKLDKLFNLKKVTDNLTDVLSRPNDPTNIMADGKQDKTAHTGASGKTYSTRMTVDVYQDK